ncbi:MAG: hypothetical protein JWM56_1233 [Candidatus Peribacteria bacterium]|nr:hypothetical protein [Candidatus Peribacteria bacterium]
MCEQAEDVTSPDSKSPAQVIREEMREGGNPDAVAQRILFNSGLSVAIRCRMPGIPSSERRKLPWHTSYGSFSDPTGAKIVLRDALLSDPSVPAILAAFDQIRVAIGA